jgi:hypothetical protein
MSRLLASATKAAASTASKLPGVGSKAAVMPTAAASSSETPPPLEPAVAQVVALAAVAVVKLEQDRDRLLASHDNAPSEERLASHERWLEGICRAVRICPNSQWASAMPETSRADLPSRSSSSRLQLRVDPSALPSATHIRPADIGPMASLVAFSTHEAILHAVIVASVFPASAAAAAVSGDPSSSAPPSTASQAAPQAGDVAYSSTARRRVFSLASLLEIDPRLIVRAEACVAAELFDVLRQEAAAEEAAKAKAEIERVRKKNEEGWGGSMGRWVATGAGIVVRAAALAPLRLLARHVEGVPSC